MLLKNRFFKEGDCVIRSLEVCHPGLRSGDGIFNANTKSAPPFRAERNFSRFR